MSNVLGEPNFTPSNRTGRSGVGAEQIGHLGSGVLQTIEEGEGAFNPSPFYYSKDVAYFQQPSLQRSHNDAKMTIPIRGFGSRGTVSLTRRWMNMGPALLHLQLPISYAWSGCEYQLRDVGDVAGVARYYPKYETSAPADTQQARDIADFGDQAYRDRFIEVNGCDTILPTSFQSEGFGFAAMTSIELDLGGAGRITYDRYANFAAIMASCPFISQRRELMRLAGGGLDLRCADGKEHAPVLWGWITAPNASGNLENIVTLNGEVKRIPNRRYVPIAWDILVPIKTPDTNYMMNRKPLDTQCTAGDVQYTFLWSQFYEWTDTGCGAPNAPVYAPQQYITDFYRYAQTHSVGNQTQGWVLPYIPSIARNINVGVTNSELQHSICAPHYSLTHGGLSLNAGTAANYDQNLYLSKITMSTPRLWANHYRVAAGRRMMAEDTLGQRVRYTASDGVTSLATYSGRPRYPQIVKIANTGDLAPLLPGVTIVSTQGAADDINKISNIVYPTGFTFAEVLNSSLKLTNPSLSAYNALRTSRDATLYYPFSYFYTQIYRITDHPFSNILNWNEVTVQLPAIQNERIYSDQNKITQLIQMPANPVTSMIVGVYREKDRKYLGKNSPNSYSPALFWNALTPLRATLWDAGNIIFDYISSSDYRSYTTIDRPDPLFVPFKGGCVKLKAEAIHATQSSHVVGAAWDRYRPSKLTPFVGGLGYGRQLCSTDVINQYDSHVTLGTTNTGLDGGSNLAYNSYPMDNVEAIMDASAGAAIEKLQPCHLTEMYEACLLEFPFVMHEPIMHEDIVQSTPSFAKTQLKLDFWLNSKLKPDNNLDDHYDHTYGLTRGAASGMPMRVGLSDRGWEEGYTYPGPYTHPVPDCTRIGVNPEHSDLVIRNSIGTSAAAVGVTQSAEAYKYCNGFNYSTDANSWNINNGSLLVHVTFCQNQVWTLSPLHTSVLSARG